MAENNLKSFKELHKLCSAYYRVMGYTMDSSVLQRDDRAKQDRSAE